VYIERNAELCDTSVVFQDEEHVYRIINRILSFWAAGRQRSPYADARLPDGSRVNVVIPVAIGGPCITILVPQEPSDGRSVIGLSS
jgi:pilus assembly protein CpaF